MENIEIIFGSVLVFATIVAWLCKPYRCKRCGGYMADDYDEDGKFWKECTKCGYKELVGEDEIYENTYKNHND